MENVSNLEGNQHKRNSKLWLSKLRQKELNHLFIDFTHLISIITVTNETNMSAMGL